MDRLAVNWARSEVNALKCAIQLSISECWGFSQVSGWAEGKWLQCPWLSTSLALCFTCEAPSRPPSQPTPPLRVPRKLGALYFPRPGLWPDLTARARLVISGKIPKGVGGGRKAETNILNSLFCKRTLLGTLLYISFSSLSLSQKNDCLT